MRLEKLVLRFQNFQNLLIIFLVCGMSAVSNFSVQATVRCHVAAVMLLSTGFAAAWQRQCQPSGSASTHDALQLSQIVVCF